MNRTPFYDKHIALGGKIVDFFGWELPVQYSTITLEHNAVFVAERGGALLGFYSLLVEDEVRSRTRDLSASNQRSLAVKSGIASHRSDNGPEKTRCTTISIHTAVMSRKEMVTISRSIIGIMLISESVAFRFPFPPPPVPNIPICQCVSG